ncbi:MAG: endonuclease III domain-containing protein [Candidatus Kariarchaeaceae archaeon]|jgi:endonuclease-3
MKDDDIHKMVSLVEQAVESYTTTVDEIAKRSKDPFKVLISTIISSRTKDEVTEKASLALFAEADTPQKLMKLSEERIKELIYPAGFYKTKAGHLKETGRILTEEYGGQTPDTIEELVKLPGVGRKTANLVVTLGFNKPGICVDTHVHRIFNRWGYIETKTPEKTEFALRDKLPLKYWIPINGLLVSYGQNICTPISPHCSKCPLNKFCPRIGVEKTR